MLKWQFLQIAATGEEMLISLDSFDTGQQLSGDVWGRYCSTHPTLEQS